MKRIVFWIWDYWYLVALAVGLGIALLWVRGTSPADVARRVKLELDAIRAKGETRQVEAKLGAERAREHVEQTYHNEIIALDAEQHRKAMELQNDPVALAQFLVRAGSTSGAKSVRGPF
jgi:hypothetical protein